MPLTLQFVKASKSISHFPLTTIGDFTVITGLNGSGKTHLLTAIKDGSIDVGIDPSDINIRYYDWSSLVPADAGQASASDMRSNISTIITWVRNAEQMYLPSLQQILREYGIDPTILWDIFSLNPDDLNLLTAHLNTAQQFNFSQNLISLKQSIVGQITASHGNDAHWKPQINFALDKLNRETLIGVTIKEFDSLPYGWQYTSLFQHSFAQMFMAYFDKYRNNLMLMAAKDFGEEAEPLNRDEFFKKNGQPPWEFVNTILSKANLPYQITYPENLMTEIFLPVLKQIESGVEVRFSELSSGEKILMSFAIALYFSSDKRQAFAKPQLLLLDEVDAPLHPMMSRQLIEIINEIIVKKEGIKVIMTTHSPSTIAVCPENAIWVMKRGVGLNKTNKNQAINILTAGIPTLSIDVGGRRQVFVEDNNDVAKYEKIYNLINYKLASERSLNFIPIGKVGQGITGCDQVITVVSDLNKKGAISIYGLIDWDNKHATNGNVFVLGENTHDGIENCLLDPILVAAAVLHEHPKEASKLFLPDGYTFLSLLQAEPEMLQRVSDTVQCIMFGEPAKKIKVKYLSGIEIEVSEAYTKCDDHKLENLVLEKFPCLSRFNQGRLINRIVDNILPDCVEFIPQTFFDVFNSILTKE